MIAAATAPLNAAPRVRHPFQQLAFSPLALSMPQMLARCLSAAGAFRHPSCGNNCSQNIHLSTPSSFLSSPFSFSGALPLRLLLLLLFAAASLPHTSALPLSPIASPTQFFVSPIGDDLRGDGRFYGCCSFMRPLSSLEPILPRNSIDSPFATVARAQTAGNSPIHQTSSAHTHPSSPLSWSPFQRRVCPSSQWLLLYL